MTNKNIQEFFPQIKQMKSAGLTYLDSAATSLKLKSVVERQRDFDLFECSNVHRGAHRLSSQATKLYEEARTRTATYLNCSEENIVFTKGTTDSLNMIASILEEKISSEDSILISEMDHHANILPWQRCAQKTGAKLLVAPVDQNGELEFEKVESILKENKVKIFSLCHSSNTTGIVNDIEAASRLAKKYGVLFSVDAAQSATFKRFDLSRLDCDFLCFSAHKVFGPFGLGITYIKETKDYAPYQVGGGIVDCVGFDKSTFLEGPIKFEAGTPNISAIIALPQLFDFLENQDFSEIETFEKNLVLLARGELQKISGFQEVGLSTTKTNILSFNFDGVHPHDLCTLLDEQGVALRSGHHCTQPLLRKFNLSGCARASFALYNVEKDVETFINATKKSLEILR